MLIKENYWIITCMCNFYVYLLFIIVLCIGCCEQYSCPHWTECKNVHHYVTHAYLFRFLIESGLLFELFKCPWCIIKVLVYFKTMVCSFQCATLRFVRICNLFYDCYWFYATADVLFNRVNVQQLITGLEVAKQQVLL